MSDEKKVLMSEIIDNIGKPLMEWNSHPIFNNDYHLIYLENLTGDTIKVSYLFNGSNSSYATTDDFTTWSWGYNNYGQLGDNSTINKSSPMSILGNKKTFCQIEGGTAYTIALDKNNKIWGWGYNSFGSLGNGTTNHESTPISIIDNVTFSQIAVGSYHSMGLDKNGTIWTWGYNNKGQLGNDTTGNTCTPGSILGQNKTFCFIDGGRGNFSLAIDKNGLCWGWGYNNYGQLGNSSVLSKKTPVSIYGGHSFCKIFGGSMHTLGLDKYGQVWSWGYGNAGRLGINSTSNVCTPVSILGNHKTFCQISCGDDFSLGIDKYGQIWSWGYNYYGQLGINLNGAIESRRTPVSILGNQKTFCQIKGGYRNSIALDKDGKIWGWGWNFYGQLGINDEVDRLTPVMITAI